MSQSNASAALRDSLLHVIKADISSCLNRSSQSDLFLLGSLLLSSPPRKDRFHHCECGCAVACGRSASLWETQSYTHVTHTGEDSLVIKIMIMFHNALC